MSRWRHAFVDGYNLLHHIEGPRAGQRGHTARERLIRRIERVVGTLADRVTLVFDGRGDAETEVLSTAVEVVFARAPLSADLWIEREVQAVDDPGSVLVVSSDRLVRQSADAAGVETMGCSEFLERCEAIRRPSPTVRNGRRFQRRLGDAFPG